MQLWPIKISNQCIRIVATVTIHYLSQLSFLHFLGRHSSGGSGARCVWWKPDWPRRADSSFGFRRTCTWAGRTGQLELDWCRCFFKSCNPWVFSCNPDYSRVAIHIVFHTCFFSLDMFLGNSSIRGCLPLYTSCCNWTCCEHAYSSLRIFSQFSCYLGCNSYSYRLFFSIETGSWCFACLSWWATSCAWYRHMQKRRQCRLCSWPHRRCSFPCWSTGRWCTGKSRCPDGAWGSTFSYWAFNYIHTKVFTDV